MKARMYNNLVKRYLAYIMEYMPKETLDEKDRAFLMSIEGKIVNLVFVGPDAFEEDENDLWLPDCLWEKVNE